MLSKKVPLHYLLLSTLIASAVTFFYVKHERMVNDDATEIENPVSPTASAGPNAESGYGIKRLSGYKYVAPIIAAGPVKESSQYAELKGDINNLINKEKASGMVNSVSVYLKNLSSANWMVINQEDRYSPGSLLKVAVLITYMRMSETMPNLLKQELVYHGDKRFRFPTEHYLSDTVREGRKYTVSELLRFMIKHSDNKATVFLENYMDTTIFKKVFTDIGMREIRFDDANYTLSVKEYSRLMKALYNAGYLGANNSEFAISMLTEGTFREGLLKELPKSVVVAHKFGEAGDQYSHELHESGIVYINNNTYLLTVMTRGTNWDKLSETISHISKLVYDKTVVPLDGAPAYKIQAEK
jgi:beta-lactamase class A